MLRPTSLLLALSLLVFTSCEFSHDEVYEEPIISALFIMTPDTGTAVVLQYLDRDGNGGRPAIINSGSLRPNTRYQTQLLLNTMGKHMTDTTSIARNPEEYQVFFLPQNGLLLKAEYNDVDANGFPIGLNTTLSTSAASTGLLTVIIKHKPDKSAQGVADGDLTQAGGRTSFEVSFEMAVSDI
jgi:hypothetical protein